MKFFLFFFFVVVSGLKILINNFVSDAELQTLWMIQLKTRPSTFFSPVLERVYFPQRPAFYQPKGRTGNREKYMSV